MDLDRVIGIVFGLMILMAVFLLPFGRFTLPSGQVSGQTFFLTVRQLIESIMVSIQQPTGLLLYEIMLIISFVIMVIAGIIGFYPMRSGAIGILGMIIVTVVSIFHPQIGFNIPSYDAGYFVAWGFSIGEAVVGKIQPHMRSKLSFLSRKAALQRKEAAVEQPVEKVTPPTDLLKPLSKSEEPELSESSVPSTLTKSPPKDLFSPLSEVVEYEEYQPPPVISLPSPPVEANVIEEEITRIRIFLALLKEEKDSGLVSEEAYDRLKARFDKILEELTEERERIARSR